MNSASFPRKNTKGQGKGGASPTGRGVAAWACSRTRGTGADRTHVAPGAPPSSRRDTPQAEGSSIRATGGAGQRAQTPALWLPCRQAFNESLPLWVSVTPEIHLGVPFNEQCAIQRPSITKHLCGTRQQPRRTETEHLFPSARAPPCDSNTNTFPVHWADPLKRWQLQ